MEQAGERAIAAGDSNRGAGLRLLSLDGGGIRGISSLIILQRLMEMINEDDPPKPCDYFDMIGGTSTGGLIAVMLGRLRMSVEEAYDAYIELSPKIFTQRQHRVNWKLKTQGRYENDAIKDGVVEILKEKKMNEEELLKDTSQKACKTDICCNNFFNPVTIDNLEFVDGATGANNPLEQMWTEATDAFKKGDKWKLEDNIQCLVSIGTGIPKFKKFDENVLGIIQTLTDIATDTESVWEKFNRQYSSMVKEHIFFRFNVNRGLENIELDEIKSISTIRADTEHYLQVETVFDKVKECVESLRRRETRLYFAYENVVIPDVAELAQECTVRAEEHLKSIQTAAMPKLEPLWEIFRHTFAYDQWVRPVDHAKKKNDNGSPINGPVLLIYNSSRVPELLEKERDAIGASFAAHLSKLHGNIGRVFYGQCARARQRGILQHNELNNDQIIQATNEVLAQLIYSEPIQRKFRLHPAKQDYFLSAFSESTASLSRSLANIEELCGYLEESVTIIFSLGEYGSGIRHIGLEFDFIEALRNLAALNQPNSRKNCRILVEGFLRSSIVPTVDEDSEYQDCLGTLSFDGIDFDIDRISAASPGTNQWLWTNDALQDWLQADSAVLWVRGKPGSGKSVLARTIIERCRSVGQLDIDNPTDETEKLWKPAHRWVYSRRWGKIYSSHSYMLRSLLFQILCYNRQAFQHVQELWRKHRHRLQDLWLKSVNPLGDGAYQFSVSKDMLRNIAQNLDKVLLIVIDGFDEGEKNSAKVPASQISQREDILRFIASLVSDCAFLKFIILSRPEPDIERILADHEYCHSIVLESESKEDIKTLIEDQLAALELSLGGTHAAATKSSSNRPSSSIETQSSRVVTLIQRGNKRFVSKAISNMRNPIDRIREYLNTHAQGVFLWVNLIFKELQDLTFQGLITWSDIDKAIRGLPTGLIDMYEDILQELKSRHTEDAMIKAQKALEWVFVASSRNGNFTLQVLSDALTIPLMEVVPAAPPTVDPFDVNQSYDETWSAYRRSLYRQCGPFIDVIRPTNEHAESFGPFDMVQLIHTTARDFLTTDQAGPLRYKLEDSRQRIEHDSHVYLRLSFPSTMSEYCPLPAGRMSHWETNIIDMLYYLEGKPLVAFALKAFPNLRASLPKWTSSIGKAALPMRLLESLVSTTQQHPQRQGILEYARKFYGERRLAGQVEFTRGKGEEGGLAALGKFFCDGCTLGLVTAVENLTVIVPKSAANNRTASPVFEILNGTLIAAICRAQRLYTDKLTAGNGYVRRSAPLSARTGERGARLLRAAIPFLKLAIFYGHTQIFDLLYERLDVERSGAEIPDAEDPTRITARLQIGITPADKLESLLTQYRDALDSLYTSDSSDPLHMLTDRRCFDPEINTRVIEQTIKFVTDTYTSKGLKRWMMLSLLTRAVARLKIGGLRYRSRQQAPIKHRRIISLSEAMNYFQREVIVEVSDHDILASYLTSTRDA